MTIFQIFGKLSFPGSTLVQYGYVPPNGVVINFGAPDLERGIHFRDVSWDGYNIRTYESSSQFSNYKQPYSRRDRF